MKNLHDIIQKNMETFDEKFPSWWDEQGLYLGKPTVNKKQWKFDEILNLPDKIKAHLLSSQLSIIQAIDEWASLKLNVLYDSYGYEDGEPEVSAKIETLSQLRSFLEKAKTKLQ